MRLEPAVMPPGVVLEHAPCEVCGADQPVPIAWRTDLFLGGTRVYTMNRCGGCGVVYQHPRPTAATIHWLYPEDTYPEYVSSLVTERPLRRLVRRYGLRKRAGIVRRHVAAGCLLDVGSSTGDFVWEMARCPGWSALGVDISPGVLRYARDTAGVAGVVATFQRAPFPDGSFAAITMWNVFEHLYDPRAIIAEVARLLQPGGVLVVTHPNLDSLDRRLFGHMWIGYELPRHLYLFPSDRLRALMAEYGLEEVERRCVYGSHAATMTSLMFLVERALGRNRLTGLIRGALFSLPARVLCAPYFVLIDRLRLGSNITAVFRR
ncbi:MAG: class I SAM-dependent methyltransferase [Chloroflexaceae bacterium]|nr:class I SAM-dependent methyltransferase [Chloroflexaceae bacterium]